MSIMENLFKRYIVSISTDKKKLSECKEMLVKHQQFELASDIRDIIQDNFPVSDKDDIRKNEATTFRTALAMADITVDERLAFITFNIARKLMDKNIQITIEDIVEVKELSEKIYG